VHFRNIYAPGTRQNHPNKPGLFRIWLARGCDTRPFPDGDYRLDVEVADIRGNASRSHLTTTSAGGTRPTTGNTKLRTHMTIAELLSKLPRKQSLWNERSPLNYVDRLARPPVPAQALLEQSRHDRRQPGDATRYANSG